MSDSTVHNLLTRDMRGDAKTVSGVSFAWDGDWYHVSGTATGDIGWSVYRTEDIPVEAGRTYTFSMDFDGDMPDGYIRCAFQLFTDVKNNVYTNIAVIYRDPLHVTFTVPDGDYKMFQLWGPIIKGGATVDLRCRWMLVAGNQPAAWAPAEGETLAGGGALMSANLLDGGTIIANEGITYSDGVWSMPANDAGEKNAVAVVPSGTEAVAENQTLHVGFSLRAADGASIRLPYGIGYVDAAGHRNWTSRVIVAKGTGGWQRAEGSLVMPSGMRVSVFFVHQRAGGVALELTAPCLSYGSPVCLASSAHTPYATQDHISATYATKASLKVLDDSITSLVKGEATYTAPDGTTKTSGIYSKIKQTSDGINKTFGQYTKTADLASTQAVKDAKKAGTDAQAAASAAQSTADSAKAAAGSAQSTADSLATMIREDATGITVGKSEDGETYSTGRTRMTASAFEVLNKVGKVLASFGGAAISLFGGLLTIAAGYDGGGEIYPANGGNLRLKSGKDAEASGNRGSYIEVNDVFASLNSRPAGGAMNSLTVDNDGILAQTQQGVSSLLCPVHSMHNPYNGAHVYTGKASEISDLKSNGWTDEGVKFYAFLDPGNR